MNDFLLGNCRPVERLTDGWRVNEVKGFKNQRTLSCRATRRGFLVKQNWQDPEARLAAERVLLIAPQSCRGLANRWSTKPGSGYF